MYTFQIWEFILWSAFSDMSTGLSDWCLLITFLSLSRTENVFLLLLHFRTTCQAVKSWFTFDISNSFIDVSSLLSGFDCCRGEIRI